MEKASLRSRSLRSSQDHNIGLAWTDIGRFAEAIMHAQRALLTAASGIRSEFGLGPRGTWILGLIATGRIRTQADVVKRYKVGRSIITEEVALLVKAGLVAAEPNLEDRRQIALRLTASGKAANVRMGDAMSARMAERLGAYTLADLMFCTGLLEDMAGIQA